MNRQPVSSSNLRSVGYDPNQQLLEIEFHSRRIYQYFQVPLAIYTGLMQAGSHGRYFHAFIKTRFRYQRLQ